MKKLRSHGLLMQIYLISRYGSTGERGANKLTVSPAIPDHCQRKRGRRPSNQKRLRHNGRILPAH